MKPGIALITLALALLACNALAPKPKTEWDQSPDAVIIEATITGGLVPMNFMENYIPEAQVWGDGRIVWVEETSNGRRVLAATGERWMCGPSTNPRPGAPSRHERAPVPSEMRRTGHW